MLDYECMYTEKKKGVVADLALVWYLKPLLSVAAVVVGAAEAPVCNPQDGPAVAAAAAASASAAAALESGCCSAAAVI